MDPYQLSLGPDVNWSAIGTLSPSTTRAREEEFLDTLGLEEQIRPTILSFEAARQKAATAASQIWGNWRRFSQIWSQHKGSITRSWSSFSALQRAALLDGAWGARIPQHHRPDIDLVLRFVKVVGPGKVTLQRGAAQQIRKERLSFQLPYVNSENLAGDGSNLVLLLESRCSNSPVYFWREDLRHQYLGRHTQLLPTIFRPYCAQLFDKEDEYGTLIRFTSSSDDQVLLKVLRQEACLVGDGFLILEAQHKLMDFLVQITEVILNSTKGLSHGLKKVEVINPSSNMAWLALKDAYIGSKELPIEQMNSISEAYSTQAESHLWRLREDPSYFELILLETLDHHWGWSRDSKGPHELMAASVSNPASLTVMEVWEWAIRKVVGDALMECEIWNSVHQVLQKLDPTADPFGTASRDAATQPKYDVGSYIDAYCTIGRCIKNYIRLFDNGEFVFASPGIRPYVTRIEPDKESGLGDTGQRRFALRASMHDDRDRRVLLALFTLLLDKKSCGTLGLRNLTNCLAFITRSFDVDIQNSVPLPHNAGRAEDLQRLLSPLLQRKISTLFALTELYHKLESCNPWVELCLQITKTTYPIKYNERVGRDIVVLQVFRDKPNTIPESIIELAMPHGGRFSYPKGKTLDEDRAKRMIVSERHLDEFCHSILRLDIIGPLSPYAMGLITDIPLNRTTTPVPRILADRQEISTTSSDRSDSPSRFGELVMPRAKADLPPRDH